MFAASRTSQDHQRGPVSQRSGAGVVMLGMSGSSSLKRAGGIRGPSRAAPRPLREHTGVVMRGHVRRSWQAAAASRRPEGLEAAASWRGSSNQTLPASSGWCAGWA